MLGRRNFADTSAFGRERSAVPRSGARALDALKSVGVALLLFSMVIAAIAGAETAFFSTLLIAWLLFPMLVGLRNTLDAGCAFMLMSVGVVVVVDLAQNGLSSLLP